MTDKIFSWKCSKCGKVIKSIYRLQFEHNKKHHINKHNITAKNAIRELINMHDSKTKEIFIDHNEKNERGIYYQYVYKGT